MISTTDATRRPSSEVLAELRVDPDRGLSFSEVEHRRERYGPNELDAEPPIPAWRRFVAQFRDPLVYLLLAAIVVSLLAWWLEGTEETLSLIHISEPTRQPATSRMPSSA